MHIAIRADGGPEIGYGHLIRANALTEEILTRGNEVSVATTAPKAAQSVFPDDVEITQLSSRGDPEPFLDWLDSATPDIVFTDSYPVDTEYQKAVLDRVPLAVLQDDDRHVVCADLFVNPNLYAADLNYEFVGQEPKTCLGTGYVLLRGEIRDRAEDATEWRDQPEQALVTMGGSDIANLMPTVIRAFDGFNIHVDAIVGPGFSSEQEQEIHETAREISTDVRVVRNPDDLPERMFESDFAVCTASSTVYELMALGTPIIASAISDNQQLIANELGDRNLAIITDPAKGVSGYKAAIQRYVDDPKLRKQCQGRGRELVDDKGAERLASELVQLSNNN